jgi:hypothetical protein
MELLIWLTLIYAAVLVGALALALIAIAALLWWTSIMLRDARVALMSVRDHTAPLGAQLGAVNDAVGKIAESIASGRKHVDRSNEGLMGVASSTVES